MDGNAKLKCLLKVLNYPHLLVADSFQLLFHCCLPAMTEREKTTTKCNLENICNDCYHDLVAKGIEVCKCEICAPPVCLGCLAADIAKLQTLQMIIAAEKSMTKKMDQ